MNQSDTSPIRARISGYKQECTKARQGYNAKEIEGVILLTGIDKNGEPFKNVIYCNLQDPDFIAFLNNYGATNAALQISLQHELRMANGDN